MTLLATTASAQIQSETTAYRALAIAPHEAAADAAVAILREGGNAVDAVIAAQMVLGVVQPQHSGLGGNGQMMVWEAPEHRLFVFEGLGGAPGTAEPDQFLDAAGEPLEGDAVRGLGNMVAVPGLSGMLDGVQGSFGLLQWDRLVAPAIALAERGFIPDAALRESLADRPSAAAVFEADGDRLRNPALARVMRRMAQDGSAAVIKGATARRIVEAVTFAARSDLPHLGLEDIEGFFDSRGSALCRHYRGLDFCAPSLPTAGGFTVLQSLGLMAHLGLDRMDFLSPQATHLMIEAGRLAAADAAYYLTDPRAGDVPLAGLLDPAYLTARAQQIRRGTAIAGVEAGHPPWDRRLRDHAPNAEEPPPGTAHIIAIDGEGRIASLVSTLHGVFGSGIAVDGFFLNRGMASFAARPEVEGRAVANSIAPGKRVMLHTAPVIALHPDVGPIFVLGTPGGPGDQQDLLRALLGLMHHCSAMGDALALPAIRVDADDVAIEAGPREEGPSAEALAAALSAVGHRVRQIPASPSRVSGAMIGEGEHLPAADPGSGIAIRGIPADQGI